MFYVSNQYANWGLVLMVSALCCHCSTQMLCEHNKILGQILYFLNTGY